MRIRLWPGLLLVAVQWLGTFVGPRVFPDHVPLVSMIGAGAGLLLILWWLFFSRIAHVERWGGLLLAAVGLIGARYVTDPSITTAGMGIQYWLFAIPVVCMALVVWGGAMRAFGDGARRVMLVVVILFACGVWPLMRSDGITGAGTPLYAWRWSATHEERLLAAGAVDSMTPAPATDDANAAPPEWPGFRGAARDGVVRGTRVSTDWSASPPVELWRRPVGPGVSSFAVAGDLFYTQEQRGEQEIVSAYRVATGEPVWRHAVAARFWDAHAGPGPRGTPTLAGGSVYALGATGLLTALDAVDGSVAWSRDAAADTGRKPPGWGFASSPLVVDDLVVVAISGTLAAYDRASGEPSWSVPTGGGSYSSPHLAVLGGVPQILMLSEGGVTGVAPADGAVLWQQAQPPSHIVQPALTAESDLLLTASNATGTGSIDRYAVAQGADGWTFTQRWSSRGLKPYFNDFVVHDGHAYGFDGTILSCIELAGGERQWKGGRYGNGQLLLLADQDLLLILSEKGEIALVGATPAGFEEIARMPAITGKTWNHPALAGDVLLVRNTEEMAAFRMAP